MNIIACLHPKDLTRKLSFKFPYMFPLFSDMLHVNSEIIYQHISQFYWYRNKTILIIGGGPSTRDVEWESVLHKVDYIWSVNHFFLNPRVSCQPISLATLSPEVSLSNQELLTFLSYNTCIGFEYNEPWWQTDFADLFSRANLFCMHTRFTSQLGAVPRLMILAHFLRVNKIYVVGFDGAKSILRGDHAFTPGKTTLPAKVTKENAVDVFDRHISDFKDYWYNYLQSKIKVINLASKMEYNMIGDKFGNL